MFFSLHIPTEVLFLLAFALAGAVVLLVVSLTRLRPVVKACRRADAAPAEGPEGGFEGVSVVVYSQDEARELERLLPSLLGQDYPAPMEVIVVNEGESSDVRDTVGMMQLAHRNLYLTYTPDGARNLSRKKLGITLGIKAARYDVVVLTTAAATVTSDKWLRRMAGHFSAGSPVEVVLGYAAVDAGADDGRGRRRRSFDYVADAAVWLSAALTGRPFRGIEHNIAYRRRTFFANKGFSRSLNLCFGDDDIFISEIATKDNTAVELSADSMVTLGGDSQRSHLERTLRHRFTERFIRRRRRFLLPLSMWLIMIAVALSAAAIALDYSNGFTVAVGTVIILGVLATVVAVWRSLMLALKGRRLLLSIPYIAATRPLRGLWLSLRSRFARQKKYTWD